MPIDDFILQLTDKDLMDFSFYRDQLLNAPYDRRPYHHAKVVGDLSRDRLRRAKANSTPPQAA